jgi:hypothetical protein
VKKFFLILVTLLQASALHAGLGYSIEQSADYGNLHSPMRLLISAINSLDTAEAQRLIEQDETLLAQYLDLFREKESHLRLVGTSPLESLIREEDPLSIDMIAVLLEKGVSPDGVWVDGKRNNIDGAFTCPQIAEIRHEKIILLLNAGSDPVSMTPDNYFLARMHNLPQTQLDLDRREAMQNAYFTCRTVREECAEREAALLKAQGAALARVLPDALHNLLPVTDLQREIGEYVNPYYGWPEEVDESKTSY